MLLPEIKFHAVGGALAMMFSSSASGLSLRMLLSSKDRGDGGFDSRDLDGTNSSPEDYYGLDLTEPTPPMPDCHPCAPLGHSEGPMPTISDSLFSLIILIYVSVIFIFMFFSFCWKEPDPPPPDPNEVKPPMITEILQQEEEEERKKQKELEAAEAAEAAAAMEPSAPMLEKSDSAEDGTGNNNAASAEMHEMQEKPLIDRGASSPSPLPQKGPEKIVVSVVNETASASSSIPKDSGAESSTQV